MGITGNRNTDKNFRERKEARPPLPQLMLIRIKGKYCNIGKTVHQKI